MPYFVYMLFSKKDQGLYVGCTTNPPKRLIDHNYGKVQSTKNRRPLELIHLEEFNDKGKAFQRERFFKSLWSARIKKKILNSYIHEIGR